MTDKLNAAMSEALEGPIKPRRFTMLPIQDQIAAQEKLDAYDRYKNSRDSVLADLHYLSQVPLAELEARFADTSTAELIDERRHYAQHGVFVGEAIKDLALTPDEVYRAIYLSALAARDVTDEMHRVLSLSAQLAGDALERWRAETTE
jgi:hypothetical protein